MEKFLVIVESPAKATTLKKYLGDDFHILASYGHIRDLEKNDLGFDSKSKKISPKYITLDDKKKVIADLKKSAKKAETVFLATDPDREGEAIAWHLQEVLKLPAEKVKRVVFNEITKSAVVNAVENPRQIDQDLVNAQQARRILDRVVGFELSPLLWKKIKRGLSAGRVQSVAVRLVVDREREITQFQPQSSFDIKAKFKNASDDEFGAQYMDKCQSFDDAKSILSDLATSEFSVDNVECKPSFRSPAAPFTTSSLQQEAARKLGFSVSRTMSVAQRLYEQGFITYMRTDSTTLSKEALASIQKEVISRYGKEYHHHRQYKTKNESAQEAHEAIRPTYINQDTVNAESDQKKLYSLIWKRSVASQMAPANIEKTVVTINASKAEKPFQAKGEVIVFPGFMSVYQEGRDDDSDDSSESNQLPKLVEGDSLNDEAIIAKEKFSRYPARYSEASLVKQMEVLGIGRPSTYAPTISTIQKREYVEKMDKDGTPRDLRVASLVDGQIVESKDTEQAGVERKKFFPTDMGLVVTDFLVDSFNDILDYQFTANLEKEFDHIAQGEQVWDTMVQSFCGAFQPKVSEVQETSGKVSGERELGEDPESGEKVTARIGPFGSFVQIGEDTEDKKSRKARLIKGLALETVTLEEALELFKLPRDIGEYEDESVVAAIGRFGPYIQHKKQFFSLKNHDPKTISLDEAIEVIEAKREADKNRIIHEFDAEAGLIQVLNGPYGPYISHNKKNVKIPKDVDPKTLDQAACEELIKNYKPSPRSFKRKKKSTKSKK